MNAYTTGVPERCLRATQKPPTARKTTQAIIGRLLRVAQPDRRNDPETDTTMLEMKRVQRRTIRAVLESVR